MHKPESLPVCVYYKKHAVNYVSLLILRISFERIHLCVNYPFKYIQMWPQSMAMFKTIELSSQLKIFTILCVHFKSASHSYIQYFFCTIFPTYTTFRCWRTWIQTHFQLRKARTLQIHLWASTVCQYWLLHTRTVPHGHCCKTTSASNFSPSSSSTWHVYKCKAIIWKAKCWFFCSNVTPNSVMTAGNHSECIFSILNCAHVSGFNWVKSSGLNQI